MLEYVGKKFFLIFSVKQGYGMTVAVIIMNKSNRDKPYHKGMGLDTLKVIDNLFLDRVDNELKRAERYRIFISLIVLDVGFVDSTFPEQSSTIMDDIVSLVQKHIRAIDNVSVLQPYKLGLLFPETTRQGAEIASKRITEVIKARLSELNNKRFDQIIHLEMASYPDAAGAKSIGDFLRDYSETNLN